MTAPLPYHPSLRHPHTGARIRAIAERPMGGYLYPMMGASPDDPPPDQTPEQKAAADKAAADTKAAADKATADQAAADKAAADKAGYPANTPVAEMTVPQQAAYWQHQAKKHEDRNKEILKVTGGKYGEDLKKELDDAAALKREKMTDQERAVADAEAKGRSSAISTASRQLAEQFFDVSLDHVPEEQRKVLLGTIDLASVVNPDGTIDTAKVKQVAGILAPKDDKSTRDRDYGGGRRGGSSSSSTGVATGRDRYQERNKKRTGTSITS